MRMVRYGLVVAVALALCGGAFAATTMWLSGSPVGTTIPGDSINVPSGGTVKLYAILDSSDIGNTFEMMVGYDTSDATTYGAGKDSNNGANKNLTLASESGEIVGSIDSFFDVFTTAGYASSQVVVDASGRENINSALGGRPYGFVGRAATRSNTSPGQKTCFSFTLRNNMPAGSSQAVVLSSNAEGNSYCDAWKHGTALYEDSYVLTINSITGQANPVVGTSGKTLNNLNAAMAASHDWVLWGRVTGIADTNNFTIDDGSGVPVHIQKTGHGLTGSPFVRVQGSLNLGTNPPTLTATSVTVQ